MLQRLVGREMEQTKCLWRCTRGEMAAGKQHGRMIIDAEGCGGGMVR